MNTAFNRGRHLNRRCVVLSWDCIYVMCYANPEIPYVRLHMQFLNATKQIAWCNDPIWVSRQAFSRKIGKKVRGVSETHGYHNVACGIYGIWALGIAGIHSQLCIADYKYRYTAGKNDFLIGLLIRHVHIHIWWVFVSKSTCLNEEVIGDQH